VSGGDRSSTGTVGGIVETSIVVDTVMVEVDERVEVIVMSIGRRAFWSALEIATLSVDAGSTDELVTVETATRKVP